jgi:hypothetical protein
VIVRFREVFRKTAVVALLAGGVLLSGAGIAQADQWVYKGTYMTQRSCEIAGKSQKLKTGLTWSCVRSSGTQYFYLYVWK